MSRRLGAQGRRQVHRRDPSKNPKACEPCGQPSHLTRNTVAALFRCLKKLESGDTLIVWKLDRLGRSLRDLIIMLDLKRRQVKFRSLTEHIDTDTPAGRAMWQLIGLLAELERSLISERTRAGVKAAKRRGVKFGRKPKLTPQQLDHARELIDKDDFDRQGIADLFKVSRTTLYRALVA